MDNFYKDTKWGYKWVVPDGWLEENKNQYKYKTSEVKDPMNGKPSDSYILIKINKNLEAQKHGDYPKNACLVCKAPLEIAAPGTKGPKQKYCDTCKPVIKVLIAKEQNKKKNMLHDNGEVPADTWTFGAYTNSKPIAYKNVQEDKHSTKTTKKNVYLTSKLNKENLAKASKVKIVNGKETLVHPQAIVKGIKMKHEKPEPCECGSKKIVKYTPDLEIKHAGTVLHCAKCGLVVADKGWKANEPKGNKGYLGD